MTPLHPCSDRRGYKCIRQIEAKALRQLRSPERQPGTCARLLAAR